MKVEGLHAAKYKKRDEMGMRIDRVSSDTSLF